MQVRDAFDEELLRSIKTDDVIRPRGLVQDIVMRTVVTEGPAVVVGGGLDMPDADNPRRGSRRNCRWTV